MIRRVEAGRSSFLRRRMFIVGASVAAISGCDGASTNPSAMGASGRANCPAGSETCACYGNGTCNDGLVCASKLCVSLGKGGATSLGGSPSAGTMGSSTAMPALGGSLGSGGGVSAAGFAPSDGGATIAGSGQGVGAENALGGGATNGGTTNGGTTNGGATNSGATNSGATNSGATNSGAGTATGGNPAVGSASGSSGALSTGGSTSVAGNTSTGGATVAQSCGNGIVEGTETCDTLPQNNDLGDGCTPTCMAEPSCPAAGGPCTSKCGDGLVLGTEDCDDANATDGDGCSAACTVEAGFQCVQPPLGDTMVVPMVVRDFNLGGDFEKGSSFATDLNYANQGLLQPTLDPSGLKPVLATTTGTYNARVGQDSGIASKASFAQWYNDAAPASSNTPHATLATSLKLYRNSDGSAYVNRFGNNGNGLTSAQYRRTSTTLCGSVTLSDHDADGNVLPCTACYLDTDTTTPQCDPPDTTPCQTDASYTGECAQSGSYWIGTFLGAIYDGNPLWFPADSLTPFSPSGTGQIPGNFDPAWPLDPSGAPHNFSFTTEVRFWFKYDSSQSYKLSILGDDDIWVFINKKLALDMGGIHTPVAGSLTLASGTGTATASVSPTTVTPATATTTHPDLGSLENGSVYEIAVFQAERQTKASSYQISLIGFNAARSVCQRQ